MNYDGTITIQTVMDDILQDIVRTLEREGLITPHQYPMWSGDGPALERAR
jgi:hypothetical protein